MGVQDSVPPGYRRGLPSCPSCGREENVLAVPAVYEASRGVEKSISQARSTLADDEASEARKAEARAVLAVMPAPTVRPGLFAPAPQSKATGCGCMGFVLAVPTVVLWIVAATAKATSTAAQEQQRQAVTTIAITFTVLTALCFAVMAFGISRNNRFKAGRPAADEVWRRGWYCTRCAIVHFAAGEEPAGVLPGQTLDPDSFRRLVWTAGGYGKRFKPTDV